MAFRPPSINKRRFCRLRNLPDKGHFEMIEALKALANEHRLDIVRTLAIGPPSNVTEMALWLNLSQSATSQHLAMLRKAGILATKPDKTAVLYRINGDMPTPLWLLVRAACEVIE
jgi:DNA-binding transcriptional ArsR family regulator